MILVLDFMVVVPFSMIMVMVLWFCGLCFYDFMPGSLSLRARPEGGERAAA